LAWPEIDRFRVSGFLFPVLHLLLAMAMLKGALIAAGHGERLRRGGLTVPKPLVPIAGTPLIERVLTACAAVGIDEVACILNEEAESDAVELHCRRIAQLDLRILRRTTPSSMESLFALAPHLQTSPFLLVTVDSVFGPRVLPTLLQGFADHPDAAGVLAVHTHIEDEKPLHLRIDDGQRIVAIGPAALDSPLITAGLYVFTPGIFAEIGGARAARYTALREFLAHLCERGYPLFAVHVEKTIDVDRPEDVVVAEAFIRSGFRP
jgi:NDP-sugar pyrophosphorylase family protein